MLLTSTWGVNWVLIVFCVWQAGGGHGLPQSTRREGRFLTSPLDMLSERLASSSSLLFRLIDESTENEPSGSKTKHVKSDASNLPAKVVQSNTSEGEREEEAEASRSSDLKLEHRGGSVEVSDDEEERSEEEIEVKKVVRWRPGKRPRPADGKRRRPYTKPREEGLVYICKDGNNCPPPIPGLPYPPPQQPVVDFYPPDYESPKPKRKFKPFIRKYSYKRTGSDGPKNKTRVDDGGNVQTTIYRQEILKRRPGRFRVRQKPRTTLATTTATTTPPPTVHSEKIQQLVTKDLEEMSLDELQEVMKLRAGLSNSPPSPTSTERPDGEFLTSTSAKPELSTYFDAVPDFQLKNEEDSFFDQVLSNEVPYSTTQTTTTSTETTTTTQTTTMTPSRRVAQKMKYTFRPARPSQEQRKRPSFDDEKRLLADMLDMTTFGMKENVGKTRQQKPLIPLPDISRAPDNESRFPNFDFAAYSSTTAMPTTETQTSANDLGFYDEDLEDNAEPENFARDAMIDINNYDYALDFSDNQAPALEDFRLRQNPGVDSVEDPVQEALAVEEDDDQQTVNVGSKGTGNFMTFSLGSPGTAGFKLSNTVLDLGRPHREENTPAEATDGLSETALPPAEEAPSTEVSSTTESATEELLFELEEEAEEAERPARRPYDNPYLNYYHPSHRYPGQSVTPFTVRPTTTTEYVRPSPFTVRIRSTKKPFTVRPTSTTTTPSPRPYYQAHYQRVTPFTVRPTPRRRFRPYQSGFNRPYPQRTRKIVTNKPNTYSPPGNDPFKKPTPFTLRPKLRTIYPKGANDPLKPYSKPFTVRPTSAVPTRRGNTDLLSGYQRKKPNSQRFNPAVFNNHDVSLKDQFESLPTFYGTDSPAHSPPPRPKAQNHRYPPTTAEPAPPALSVELQQPFPFEEYEDLFEGELRDDSEEDSFESFPAFETIGDFTIDSSESPLVTFGENTFPLGKFPDRPNVKSDKRQQPYLKNPYGSNFVRLEVDIDRFQHNKSAVGIRHIPLMVMGERPKGKKKDSKPHLKRKRKQPGFQPTKHQKQHQKKTKPAFIPAIRVQPHSSIKPKASKSGSKSGSSPPRVAKEDPFKAVKSVLPNAIQNLPELVQKIMSGHASWIDKTFSGRELKVE